jgi:hypothetical protein
MLFADADRLKIDEIAPATATRRRHESLERTEVVSRFLDAAEGIVPQTLSAQFGYFAGLQWWAPILIPALFFVLGNALRPAIAAGATRLGRVFAARVHFGPVQRQTGTVLSREQLRHLVPGETTREQVMAIAGAEPEEVERLEAPDRRALIYRGRRVIPHRRRRFGWFSTVAAWEIEEHEVEITVERDVVQNVQARVRHSRRRDPTPASVPD